MKSGRNKRVKRRIITIALLVGVMAVLSGCGQMTEPIMWTAMDFGINKSSIHYLCSLLRLQIYLVEALESPLS